MNEHPSLSDISLAPIGVVHTPFHERYLAPIQAEQQSSQESVIELLPHLNYETALRDLDGFSHIWVLWFFHEARSWKPIIQTPRDGSKHGVFATRSPHRPNPLAISAVQLLSVEGRFVRIRGADMLDGTPVLDIKPYIPLYDSFAEARAGWTDSASWHATHSIAWSDHAAEQVSFIDSMVGYTLRAFVDRRLHLNPNPTASNRIVQLSEEGYTLASRAWRVDYTKVDTQITIDRIRSAYSPSDLPRIATELNESETAAHCAFLNRYPS